MGEESRLCPSKRDLDTSLPCPSGFALFFYSSVRYEDEGSMRAKE